MKRWLIAIIPLVILGLLISWRLQSNRKEAAVAVTQRTMRMHAVPIVDTSTAVRRDVIQQFEAVGNIDPPLDVKLAGRVTGRILMLDVHEGDPVHTGQVLVRIDPADMIGGLNQAQATLAEAQSRLAQAQLTQNPTNVGVTTQIQQQRANLQSMQADYSQTSQNYAQQVAAARAAVVDARAKVAAANSSIAGAGAGVRSAQANLDNYTAKYNREDELYKQGFVAAQDVDDARTAVGVGSAAVDVAQQQLNGATSAKASTSAQLQSAQDQLKITITKGKSDVEAARQRVVQAQAALDFARANRAQTPAYQANLAALRATVTAATAAVHSAQARLGDVTISSPIDGFVTGRYMDPGSMATPGAPLLSLESIKQVWVTVPIPEEQAHNIYMGQTASVTLDALPGKSYIGKVIQINPAADTSSRQFPVRVLLNNPGDEIRPGMFAHVSLVTGRVKGAVVVPHEAVQADSSGANTVQVVGSDGTIDIRPVTLGVSDLSGVQVTSGVQPGEKVVVMSASALKQGEPVRISGAGHSRKR